METLYKITWQDASAFDGILQANQNLPIRISVGFLIRDDQHCMALCYLKDTIISNCMHDQDESEGIAIPKAMIKKIERFKIKEEQDDTR